MKVIGISGSPRPDGNTSLLVREALNAVAEEGIETDNGTENPKNEKAEPLSLEIKNFIDAIEGKNDLVVKPEQAVNVTKVAEAALLSSQRGTPIYLDLR